VVESENTTGKATQATHTSPKNSKKKRSARD